MTSAQMAGGRLSVCPTPIGNMEDITLRVLSTLAQADVVACEDTRHTRVLLSRHGIATPLVSLHERNEGRRARELARRVRAGERVALVSDAGTPLISDPGFALVRACLDSELPVEVLPGASAVLTALVASGMPAARWCFVGFLPRRGAELGELLANAGETLVAFESPHRLSETLRRLAAQDPERELAVCRELTKLHEEVRRGSAASLASHYAARGRQGTAVRGEITLVIGPADRSRAGRERAVRALGELVAAGARPRAAASALAGLTGLGANELYRELMACQGTRRPGDGAAARRSPPRSGRAAATPRRKGGR
jgi:16S rRNA (cytidine1402-2'-O)-methyltransferase